MPSILIAEPGTSNAHRLTQAAVAGADPQPEVEVCASLEMALEFAEQHPVDAVIVGPSLVGDLAFELASYLNEAHKAATIIVTAESRYRRPSIGDALGCGRCHRVRQHRCRDAASLARASAASAKLHPATAQGAAEAQPLGKVLTVFSTKGGVGKSVLSTNLAVAIAKITKARVAMIDLDLEFGDVESCSASSHSTRL